jgi:hypothetical protein
MKLTWTPWCNTLVARPESLHNYSIRQDKEQVLWSVAHPTLGATGYASSVDEAKQICQAIADVREGER